MREAAKCHPERDTYTRSSNLCGPCYRHEYYVAHREKWREYTTRWRKQNLDRARELYRNWYYRNKAIRHARNGPAICRICGTDQNIEADHDHKRGRYWKLSAQRGWLCNRCNTGLGQFRDDPELLSRAIAYLTTHGRDLDASS